MSQRVFKSIFSSELQAREALAKAHHLAAFLNLDDTVFNHLSLRSNQDPECFYLAPFGLLFEEVTSENLLKIRLDGTVLEGDHSANPAGYIIHSAVYEARQDVKAIVHLHSPHALAVSCLDEGLLPLTQFSMIFHDNLAYHPFEGISLDREEKDRLTTNLGTKPAMLLQNHGLLTAAESLSQAFMTAYYLERSCQVQLLAQSTGRPLIFPSREVAAHTAAQFAGPEYHAREKAYEALLRRMHRTT